MLGLYIRRQMTVVHCILALFNVNEEKVKGSFRHLDLMPKTPLI